MPPGNPREYVLGRIHAYFDGINAERYREVAELFSPAGELRAPGSGPRRDRPTIADYFAAALAPYPEHCDQPERIFVDADTATVEIHFTGRTASGAVLEFDAVDVFDFNADGLITLMTSWYDSYAVHEWLRKNRG